MKIQVSLIIILTLLSGFAFAETGSFKVYAVDSQGVIFLNPLEGKAKCEFTTTGQWSHGDNQRTDANGEGTSYGACGNYGTCYREDVRPGTLVARRVGQGENDVAGLHYVKNMGDREYFRFVMNDTLNSYGDNAWSLVVTWECGPK